MNNKHDILIFLSDQHRGDFIHYAGNPVIRTPNLDRIAADGTVFTSAYSPCPLCVPARTSLLSGQLAMHTEVYTNHGAIRSDNATFLHSLGAEGYETVLCGRMHFEGPDQRHGFSKRIFGDLLQLYPGQEDAYNELKYYRPTISENGCSKIYGGGDHSPTLDYDRLVINAALDYLNEEHEKPQCIVVGVYAPHFPFVGPTDLYEYYLDILEKNDKKDPVFDYDLGILNPRQQIYERSQVLRMRAAYYAMVENLDMQIGKVKKAFDEYEKRRGASGIFIYTSDHGESLGDRNMFAKKTLFDNAARVPLVINGDGIKKGQIVSSPVSIMDIGPTLCDMENCMKAPDLDAYSLKDELENGNNPSRVVFSECMEKKGEQFVPGIMVRKGDYKLIWYYDHEDEMLLFNLKDDKKETHNLISVEPDILEDLMSEAKRIWNPEHIIKIHENRLAHIQILMKWGKSVHPVETERWHIPASSLAMPEKV